MKKFTLPLLIGLIIGLSALSTILYIKNNELKNTIIPYNEILSAYQKTYNNQPVASINIQPFLVKKFCEAATGENVGTSTWDYETNKSIQESNVNNKVYFCYIKDQKALVDIYSPNFDPKSGYAPNSICNRIFNSELFRGVATDDQNACTLITK